MQVNRYFGDAERVIAVGRQAVPEPNDGRLAISTYDRWAWKDTIEAPDICLAKIGVEPMRAGPGFQFRGEVGRGELSPALMIRPVGLIRIQVWCLGWLWIQWTVYRWKRNR